MSEDKEARRSSRRSKKNGVPSSSLERDDSADWRDPKVNDSPIAYPIAAGVFIVGFLTLFVLMVSGPDQLGALAWELALGVVQETINTTGWALLGIAAALLAAALTAVSIVGYRSSMEISPPKLESIRDTINGLVVAATVISSGLAAAYFLSTVSLTSFDKTMKAWAKGKTASTPDTGFQISDLPNGAQDFLESGFNSMLLGVAAVLLVMVAYRINPTVDLWFRSDSEVHERERDLLVERNENSRTRIKELDAIIGRVSRGWAIFRAIVVNVPVSILSSALLAWPVSLLIEDKNRAMFIALVTTAAIYLAIFIAPLSLQLVALTLRGPLTQRLKKGIGEAKGRWAAEIILWSLSLLVIAIPAVVIYCQLPSLVEDRWYVMLPAVIVGIAPSAAFAFGVSRLFSWRVLAAFSARQTLTLMLYADRQRLNKVALKTTRLLLLDDKNK